MRRGPPRSATCQVRSLCRSPRPRSSDPGPPLLHRRVVDLLPQAAALGVTILAGSDTIPPARFWQEIATLFRYGLDPTTALASATTAARAYLGLHDLDEGSPADVVLYDADPRNDPEILQRPSLVMVAGEIAATT